MLAVLLRAMLAAPSATRCFSLVLLQLPTALLPPPKLVL
jgi:hypothetical protein